MSVSVSVSENEWKDEGMRGQRAHYYRERIGKC